MWHAHHGISNHQQLVCLFKSSFRQSKLCITGPLGGEPPAIGGFPSQRASNDDDQPWWSHYHFIFPKSEFLYGEYSIFIYKGYTKGPQETRQQIVAQVKSTFPIPKSQYGIPVLTFHWSICRLVGFSQNWTKSFGGKNKIMNWVYSIISTTMSYGFSYAYTWHWKAESIAIYFSTADHMYWLTWFHSFRPRWAAHLIPALRVINSPAVSWSFSIISREEKYLARCGLLKQFPPSLYPWLSGRLWYLQCISNGHMAVLY